VSVPLVANTVVAYEVAIWSDRIDQAATTWIADVPDAMVTGVDSSGTTFYIHIDSPTDLPPTDDLLDRLEGEIPGSLNLVIDETVGRQIELGTLRDR
jgi:hypothetical protein